MSFNIHHGVGVDGRLDLDRIARVIAGPGTDLAGLQEVDRYFAGRSGYADQAGWLAQRLGMHLAYGPAIDLAPAEPGGPRRQYGNALLSRHPIDECRTTPLPRGDSPEERSSPEERGLLCARVQTPGRPLHVYVTHLHHSSAAGRLTQARRVREEIGASEAPVILLGDLNATPGTREVREIGRAGPLGLVDAWERAGDGPGRTFDARWPRVRIDYVLTSPDLTAVAATVPDTRASDHRPVLARFTW